MRYMIIFLFVVAFLSAAFGIGMLWSIIENLIMNEIRYRKMLHRHKTEIKKRLGEM